jgi:formylmethanofuran dehydrogenase subunit E
VAGRVKWRNPIGKALDETTSESNTMRRGYMTNSSVTAEVIQKALDFHGHMCPGLALGIRAAEIALREIGPHSQDEEIVAVVETDMCAVDAIQILTGCTFGKGNLICKDYGKKAFGFYRRSDGKGIRIVARPKIFVSLDSERQKLIGESHPRTLTAEEEKRLDELKSSLVEKILQAPLEDLFEIKGPRPQVPASARIHQSIICQVCGEEVMETRIQLIEGKRLCIPCSEKL